MWLRSIEVRKVVALQSFERKVKDGDYLLRRYGDCEALRNTAHHVIGMKERARMFCLDNAPVALAVIYTLRAPEYTQVYCKN